MLNDENLYCECGKPATWVRRTQFAGSHPFCTEHAKQEEDFGTGSSYSFWKEIPVDKVATELPKPLWPTVRLSRNRKRKVETEVERAHGHCADELMKDFGIPKEMREKVCEEVAKVWKQVAMIHCTIIWSVRGYQPHAATHGLEHFLHTHATCEQKNRKQGPQRSQGHFDSKGDFHWH